MSRQSVLECKEGADKLMVLEDDMRLMEDCRGVHCHGQNRKTRQTTPERGFMDRECSRLCKNF